ncbi:MAG: hypothetical protein KDD44_07435 [Bdellovibrionales bacterium]|nr:hypothetical protein [Bdellovibrionales bacterium]
MKADQLFYKDITRYRALVVGARTHLLTPLRTALKSIGISNVTPFPTLAEALPRATMSETSHIFIDLSPNEKEELGALEFVQLTREQNPDVIVIVISEDPGVDNVFELIQAGSRGFLVPPPTLGSVEHVLIQATSGPPFAESLLRAPDRNAAFAALVLDLLYRVATVRRELREGKHSETVYQKFWRALVTTVNMARVFAEGGEARFLEKLYDECIRRSDPSRTRLGSVRKNLTSKRKVTTSQPTIN